MPSIIVPNGSGLSPTQVQEQVFSHYAERDNWYSRFIGTGPESIIQKLTDLEKNPGDTVKVTLFAKLNGPGKDGDAVLETNEEAPVAYQDTLVIDQKRHADRVAGKMTNQRSAVKIYTEASMLLGMWGRDWMSELISVYYAGRRGTRTGLILPTSFTSFAGNALQTSDAAHTLWAGAAGTEAGMTAGDTFSTALIDLMDRQINLLINSGTPMKFPKRNGEEIRPLKITPEQWYDLQRDPAWVAAQQSAGERGAKNNLFTGAKGTWKGYDIFVDPAGVLFTTSGSITAASAQVLGCQSGLLAFGGVEGASEAGGGKWLAVKDTFDYGNQTGFAIVTICGFKKARINSTDHAVFTLNTGYTA